MPARSSPASEGGRPSSQTAARTTRALRCGRTARSWSTPCRWPPGTTTSRRRRMTPADDHDDTWLVYADWLDDHDRPERATLVRHDVETPSMASLWIYEYRYRVVGGGGVGGVVVGVGVVG